MIRRTDIARDGTSKEDPEEQLRVLDSETLNATLHATIARFLEAAGNASDDLKGRRESAEVATPTPPDRRAHRSERDIAAKTFQELRGALTDEINVVAKLEGDEGIEESEREREIAKGALAMLRKPELERAAKSLNLPTSGTKADLLGRVVERIGPNPHEIADLIGRIERHPSEGRRHAARLFVFENLPSAEALTSILREYEDRYVRTDLARWFVLEQAENQDGTLVANGRLRTYDIDVQPSTLDAHQRNFPVQLRVVSNEPVLRAYSRLEPEGIAAIEAFALLVDQLPTAPLSEVAAQPSWGQVAGVDPQTAWLLGVLLALLDRPDMTLEDVTSASFEKPRGSQARGLGVPYVGSARLRGQHVLDSQIACRHLASGERLNAVTAMVRFKRTDEESFVSLPVRIAVGPAYAAVMTGFGVAGVEESRNLHRRLEDDIVRQVQDPSVDLDELNSTVEAMLERARATETPETADLFARVVRGRVKLDALREGS